jgi:hypothetical protein
MNPNSFLGIFPLASLASLMLLASLAMIIGTRRALSTRSRLRRELARADELVIEARLRNW